MFGGNADVRGCLLSQQVKKKKQKALSDSEDPLCSVRGWPNLEGDDKKLEQRGTDQWLQSHEMIPSNAGKDIKEGIKEVYPSCDVFAQKDKR